MAFFFNKLTRQCRPAAETLWSGRSSPPFRRGPRWYKSHAASTLDATALAITFDGNRVSRAPPTPHSVALYRWCPTMSRQNTPRKDTLSSDSSGLTTSLQCRRRASSHTPRCVMSLRTISARRSRRSSRRRWTPPTDTCPVSLPCSRKRCTKVRPLPTAVRSARIDQNGLQPCLSQSPDQHPQSQSKRRS